jgi:replication factor C large subunit
MVGNEEARARVAEWFDKWSAKSKPLLLTGPPGTGKTTLAHAAARAHKYGIVELNASDARSKSRLANILDPMRENQALAGRTMLFIDEVDGIHGRSDYGGAAALLQFLKAAAIPVVMASNSEDAGKMRDIVKASVHVRFRPVPPRLLRMYLARILESEGVRLGPGTIIRIVSEARGDIRSMLNRAQALAGGLDPQTATTAPEPDTEEGITAFFGAESQQEAAAVLYSMWTDPREKINAIYSSIVTADLDPGRRARLLDAVSEADMLHGRILSTQNWRLLRYLNPILARTYEKDTPVRYARYNLDFRVLNRIRFDGPKIRALNRHLGKRLHMSGSAVAALALPYYVKMVGDGTIQAAEEFVDIISKEGGRR